MELKLNLAVQRRLDLDGFQRQHFSASNKTTHCGAKEMEREKGGE